MKRSLFLPLLLVWSLSSLAAGTEQPAAQNKAEQQEAPFADDVIAKVGNEPITFNQINTMLNSSAVVGLSLPTLGTPERDQVRLTLLDKVISANLLYLDAIKQGLDKDPDYQRALKTFSDSMLIDAYRRKYQNAKVMVSDKDVHAYYEKHIVPGTELTEELKTQIEAVLRDQRLAEQQAAWQASLRKGVEVVVDEQELDPEEDMVRTDATVIATVDDEPVSWGEIKGILVKPLNAGSMENRRKALDQIIDYRIMARKARAAGLERDPLYQVRVNQFRKTRLINMHRANLFHTMAPGDEEMREYYEKHRDEIYQKPRRKIQIVVLGSKEDAEAVKSMVESGMITMYQAAAEYSILQGAKDTLGEIGWVTEGTGFPELDELAFSVEPGKIGGPVETPNGWHLVKVQDVDEALFDDIEDEETRKLVRRHILKEKLAAYVVDLRMREFPVEVDDKKLSYLMQKEVEWYQAKQEKGAQPPEKVLEEIEKLRGEPVH